MTVHGPPVSRQRATSARRGAEARSDCGLYVHVHLLAGDGVWHELPGGDVVFRPLTDLREVDLVRVLDDVTADLVAAAVLDDELPVDDTLAACVQLSLSTHRPRPRPWSSPASSSTPTT
jgi:hypothetical protein